MNIQLNDNGLHLKFAPLTLTRPVGNLRVGLFTLMKDGAFFYQKLKSLIKLKSI